MNYLDEVIVAEKNLFRNKLRSLLTLIGAAVGIAAFVSLTAVSDGFKNQLQDIIKSHSIDVTVMSKGAANPIGSTIPLADFHALRKIGAVRNLSSLVMGPVRSPWASYFMIFGVSSLEGFLNKLGIVEGRVFRLGQKEVLLGEAAARRFQVKLHDKVLLGDLTFEVVGIYTSGSRIIDGAAVVDIPNAQKMLKRYDSINMAFIQITEGTDPQKVVQTIIQEFPNLSAVSSGEFISQIKLIRTIHIFAWIVTIISFVTCCIIIMNTFLMSVSERTKEIGILMAIGWSRSMIMRTIVSEAAIICLLGGIIGNLMGLVQLWLFSTLNPEGLGWVVPTSIPTDILVESFGLSLLLGIAGSVYPALRASRLLPAEALRCE